MVPINSPYVTNWHPISQIIGQIFAVDMGVPLFNTYSGWTPELRTTKFDVKKLETSLYRMKYISTYWII